MRSGTETNMQGTLIMCQAFVYVVSLNLRSNPIRQRTPSLFTDEETELEGGAESPGHGRAVNRRHWSGAGPHSGTLLPKQQPTLPVSHPLGEKLQLCEHSKASQSQESIWYKVLEKGKTPEGLSCGKGASVATGVEWVAEATPSHARPELAGLSEMEGNPEGQGTGQGPRARQAQGQAEPGLMSPDPRVPPLALAAGTNRALRPAPVTPRPYSSLFPEWNQVWSKSWWYHYLLLL